MSATSPATAPLATRGVRYIITIESAISGDRTCNIGDGPTPAAAWVDAFGPKPWGDFAKRSAKRAWVREVEMDKNEPVYFRDNQPY